MALLVKLNSQEHWLSEDGVYPIYPNVKHAGTEDVSLIYSCQPFYAYVVGNARYMVTFGLLDDPEKYPSCKENAFNYIVNEMGIEELTQQDIVEEKLWSLGSQILPSAEEKGMYEALYSLQGHNGLFMIGETIAGFTVPNQMEFILKHKSSWFETMNNKGF